MFASADCATRSSALVRLSQLDRIAAEVKLHLDIALCGRRAAQAIERNLERPFVEPRRTERTDKPPGLGKVVVRGETRLFDVRGRSCGVVPLRQLPLPRPQQQLDARQALGEGVVNLPRQPLAFGGHTGGMTRLGQLAACSVELVDELPPPLTLAIQRPIAEGTDHRDRRAEHRPDHRREGERVLVGDEAADRHQGGQCHRRERPSLRQQVQLQQEQWERHPGGVGRERQEHEPRQAQRRQPRHSVLGRCAAPSKCRAHQVEAALDGARDNDSSGVSRLIDHRTPGRNDQQRHDQQIQSVAEGDYRPRSR
ncbi:MAG: hypothetical protein R2704_12090 [Microthrixaceae bacterium]